ncbi:NAD(P)H-hydrate dehydratase [Lolliginicoccus suaedae]|uniref:NAD(P)H-hydrate dehydratase n=1 Tax=Lolliginicoccus suaedae TaxID=2605429 RepID=UPI001F1C78C9|nr:NAD(P)H-hydrate dehydratase [Lolliginicoccus suaedae]
MPLGYFTVAEIRDAESALFARVADGVPMRRAAWGLAAIVARELRARTGAVAGRRVGLLVGSGDNGGDALWAGAFLRRRGVAVDAVLLSPDRAHPAGLAALRAAGGRIVPALGQADLVLDGIVGISGRGPLRPAAAEHVAGIRSPIIAVDLPSGVDADSGAVQGPAVRAALTVTFGARKPGHALAGEWCGGIEVVDIGLELPPPSLAELTDTEVGARWPVPGPRDHKYTLGVTGVVAGSARYRGAAVLAAGGAISSKSGMVRCFGGAAATVVERYPEAIVADDLPDPAAGSLPRIDGWVIGPGMGTSEQARAALVAVLQRDAPTVVDADGLTLLAADSSQLRDRSAPIVMTPHDGEIARLLGEPVGDDRIAAATEASRRYDATVLLKGHATIIASPGSAPLVVRARSSWAATPGTGDILAGMVGALLSARVPPHEAAAMAAHAHARAARIAAGGGPAEGGPISASQLLAAVPAAIRALRSDQ